MNRGSSHRLPVNTAHHLYALRVKYKKKSLTSDSACSQGLVEWRRLNMSLPRLLLLKTHLPSFPTFCLPPPCPPAPSRPPIALETQKGSTTWGFLFFCRVPRLSLQFQGAVSQIEVTTSSHYDMSEGQEVSAENSGQRPVTAAPVLICRLGSSR